MRNRQQGGLVSYATRTGRAIIENPERRTIAVAAVPAGDSRIRRLLRPVILCAPLVVGLGCSYLLCGCTEQEGSRNRDEAAGDGPSLSTSDPSGGTPVAAKAPTVPISSPEDSTTTPGSRAIPSTLPPADNAQDVLEELAGLDWDGAMENPARATQLLQRLKAMGPDALVPLRDYLLEPDNEDSVPPSLRRALLEVLLSLGLSEIEDLALALLGNTPAADEVVQLGLYLESAQPGKYSDVILSAAEQALIDANPDTALPTDFFLLLGALGTGETAVVLSELQPQYGAYASLTLAALPDGAGLHSLERDARLFEAGQDTLQGRLAVQLLAQLAPQFPQAAASLIDLAEKGAIPPDIWPYVLDIVAGNWELTLIEPQPGNLIGSHTYYRPEGYQVIYRSARPYGQTDDGFQSQRLYLLDRLQPLAPSDSG